MSSKTPRTLVIKLTYFSVVSDNLSALKCRECRSPLDIHQPNPNQPEQFLATCPDCDRWYLLSASTESSEAILLQLPEVGEIYQQSPTSDSKTLL